jgi:hypothetical protein
LSAAGEHLAARDFLDDITGGFFDVADPRPEDYGTARGLITRYEGKMEQDYRVVKPLSGHGYFTVLPADES